MLLIGSQVPSFSAQAIRGEEVFTLTSESLKGSYTLLFFYSLDFSFVCPGELHALQENLNEFTKRNTKVIAISVDSLYLHKRMLATPKAYLGAKGTEFPLVSDMSHKLSRAFDVLDEASGHSLRASFILDEDTIVQYGSANEFAFGRSIRELLRIIDAIQSIKAGTEDFCVMNWQKNS